MDRQPFFSRLRRLAFPTWSIPIAVAVAGLLAYGLLLPSLGFYWDDWAKIAVSKLFGLGGYWAYYAGDRPLSAWTHILFTPLLGDHPISWQIFQLALEILSAVGFYWTMSQVWPRQKWPLAAGALLFLVYPVFTARSAAVTFHQQWLQFSLYFCSLGQMLLAGNDWPVTSARSAWRYWGLTGLALFLAALQLSVTEYFAPLELLRPLLIWIVLRQPTSTVPPGRRRRLRLMLERAAPYLALIVVYGAWRLFFMRLEGSDPYSLTTVFNFFKHPLQTLQTLAPVVLGDSLYSLLSVWGAPLTGSNPFGKASLFPLLACGLSLTLGVFAAIFLLRLAISDPEGEMDRAWPRQAAAVGGLAFVLGVLPAWITGRQVVFDFHSDRYAMPAMLGASLLWVAFISWLTPNRLRRALLVGVLVSLATVQQLGSANDARWIWAKETRFFWQLYWRVPYLQPGTALLTYDEIFPNQGLFSLSSALNLLYPSTPGSATLPYWWYTLSPRYESAQFVGEVSLNFQTKFRSLAFSGQTPNTLLVYYDPAYSNCLWVIRPEDNLEANLPELVKTMSSISNLERVKAKAPENWRPSESLFGPEPEQGWCYYYEKADLARQVGDWKTAAALGDQAVQANYTPLTAGSNSPHEWLPFIEAYARQGEWAKAMRLSMQLENDSSGQNVEMQALWERLRASTPDTPEKLAALDQMDL